MLSLSLAAALSIVSPLGVVSTSAAVCDIAEVKSIGDLQQVLGSRAVEAIRAGSGTTAEDEGAFTRFIATEAVFTLGAGDVGRTLGIGPSGLRTLAQTMSADTFRYLGWDYIPTPIHDACAMHEVEVEFVDAERQIVFPVTFTFEGGRIVSAIGWTRSYVSGPMTPSD